MKHLLIVICAVALGVGAGSAFAGTQDNAVIALHSGPHLVKGDTPCDWADGAAKFPCSDFLTLWPVSLSSNVYLVVAKGEPTAGIAALSCGVAYDAGAVSGVDVYAWILCTSGLQFPNDGGNGEWPASLGGNRITWNAVTDCQRTEYGTDGVHAIAGSFYVYAYSPDVLSLTMNNNLLSGPEYQVGDCSNSITDLNPTFASVMFGGVLPGCNPCTGIGCEVPVTPTTWGRIKTNY